MMRPIVLWSLALAAIAAIAAGGYLLGSSTAPSTSEAATQHAQAARLAFASAREQAFTDGLTQGRRAGLRSGKAQGQQRGSALGSADANTAVRHALFTRDGTPRGSTGGPPGPTRPALAGSGGILVVGDSLEVLTSPYLQNYLPEDRLTINAVGGYSSIQIFGLFEESYDPSQSVIVFDAGTNDNPAYPEILAGELQKVSEIVGNRCMVVPTIHGLVVNGLNSDAKNQVVRQFAASRPGTQTPNWARAVATHPELMQPDNLHPIAEGADYRAQLIADGVAACLNGSGAGLLR